MYKKLAGYADGLMSFQERRMYTPRTFWERQINFGPLGIHGDYGAEKVFNVDGIYAAPVPGEGSDDEEPECLLQAQIKADARMKRRAKKLAEKVRELRVLA